MSGLRDCFLIDKARNYTEEKPSKMTIKQLKEAIQAFPEDAVVTIKGSQKVMEGAVVIEQDEEHTWVYDTSKDPEGAVSITTH
jgi:hypothetical protein